jgi:ABC-type molybdate transport system permease subunit
MTTVTELIAYLQTLPPETTVDVLEEISAGYSTFVSWADLTLPTEHSYDCSDTLDFSKAIGEYGPTLSFGKRS